MTEEYPMAPDSEWPEAWIMPDDIPEGGDQCLPNRCSPNIPVGVPGLKDIGISFWKLDADSYEYPVKAVPWDPKDALDPKLKALRDARGYSYADIITIHPDHLPEFDLKIKSFFEEVSLYLNERRSYIFFNAIDFIFLLFSEFEIFFL